MQVVNRENVSSFLPQKGRILVVHREFKPYLLYGLMSSLTFGYFKKYFDYQTNPKDLDYLFNRSWGAFNHLLEKRELEIDYCLLGGSTGALNHEKIMKKLPEDLSLYDAIVLIYPDSIGLGNFWLEHQLKKSHRPLIILNGRNRVFLLDAEARRKLYLRRFLEKSLLLEFFASIAFVISTPFYLLYSLIKPIPTSWRESKVNRQIYEDRQGISKNSEIVDIQNFWNSKPMTYGDDHGKTKYKTTEIAREDDAFFDMVDKKFYSWNLPLHKNGRYFSEIFPYEKYRGKEILEVGCGMGTMSMNWAKNGGHIHAVDLTPEAIRQTKRRFELKGLKGDFQQADGRELPFEKDHFDYVYSWGVLHHSPDLKKSIGQLERVLKPGGEIGMMLYSRDSFFQWFLTEFRQGWLHLENEFLSPLELASRYGDDYQVEGNPHTWPIKFDEIPYLYDQFQNIQLKIMGTDLEYVFWRTFPFVAFFVPRFIKKAYARRYGWSLWISAQKPQETP